MNPYLQLGLMLPSTSGGLIIADTTPPQNVPSWALNRDVTQAAEAAGLDFVLSQVKWRGYGGTSKHWDSALESFTLMAALAAVTKSIRLFASIAIKTVHPAVIAKMAATIDEVSDGRFGVNIVAGWNKLEYAQMGLWQDDDYYKYRYEYAEEYLTVLRKCLEREPSTFDGKFFQLAECNLWPKPKKPLPIVCAGQSEAALDFVARQSDFSFVGRMNDTPEELGRLSRRIADMAATHGRKVGAYVLLTIIAEDSDAAAQARKQYFLDHADPVAIQEWMRVSGMDMNRVSYASLDPTQRTFMAVPYVAASHAKVAEHLDALAAGGVAGVCMTFPDFAADVPRFVENVLPLMKARPARSLDL